MNWSFDDGEHTDMKGFSSTYSRPSPGQYPSQPALSEMALSGRYTCPLHVNPHHGYGFDLLYTGQVHTFLPGIPYQYEIGGALHPAQHQQQLQNRQYDHEMAVMYQQPISPVSDYQPHVVKPNDDEFAHVNHPSREGEAPHLHQPTPAYLPPTSVLFNRNLCPPPDSPLSTPFHSPTKQEEEYMDQVAEVFTPPLRFSAEPTEAFMSQDIGEEDENELQEPSQNYLAAQLERPLATPVPASDDTDHDKTAPYAVLIHRALMSTPTRRMVLAEIYEYFREKIPRFRKVKGRGWMNSIRHNLSMNGAFLKEDRPPEDPGKGYIWVLSEEAAREGVKSTTRYRKSPPNSKKRVMDEAFLRGSAGRRRRKSTRKWTTAKSRSHPKSIMTIVKDELHERDPTPQLPSTPVVQHEISVSLPTDFTHMRYNYNVGDSLESSDRSITPESCNTLDYSNCYPSFPHFGASHTIYNSEDDDDWCFAGPAADDQFSEEYTLVTQN